MLETTIVGRTTPPNFIAMSVLLSLVTEAKKQGMTDLPIASLEEVLIKLKG